MIRNTILKFLGTAALAGSLFSVSGCISTQDGETYRRGEARTVQSVSYGTVIGTRPVVIEGTKSNVGTAAGGIIGGVAGSSVGDGSGSIIASTVGAVIGGIIGATTEEAATRAQGIELTIQKPDGSIIAVVQEDNENVTFPINSRVQLVRSRNILRAVPVADTQQGQPTRYSTTNYRSR